jgi:class 3 adenylate cyclase
VQCLGRDDGAVRVGGRLVLVEAVPETRYAKSGDSQIAFQVVGDGSIDILFIPHFTSRDVESRWESGASGPLMRRLARFARVITFDKRGTGLSGRVLEVPTFEEQMDDVVAVLDTVGSTRTAVIGIFDGAVLGALFAATYPHRTRALVTWMLWPRVLRAADYPWGIDAVTYQHWIDEAYEGFGLAELRERLDPDAFDDEEAQRDFQRVFRLHAGPSGVSAFMRMWGGMDIRPVLPTIRVPTLVLHRARADLVPADVGRYVASTVVGARHVEIDGTNSVLERADVDDLGDQIEEFLTGTRPLPDPDRVLATVLFTDVVNSAQRAAELGDRRWRQLIASHDALVRHELAKFRGDEVKTMGDAFLARFDGPARAVRCAHGIRDALRDIGVEIRAGIHTGEIELLDNDVSGIAVTVGKRIESLARPGEVLVSRTVVDLVAGSGIEFVDRGDHELKGIPGTWRLFTVTG